MNQNWLFCLSIVASMLLSAGCSSESSISLGDGIDYSTPCDDNSPCVNEFYTCGDKGFCQLKDGYKLDENGNIVEVKPPQTDPGKDPGKDPGTDPGTDPGEDLEDDPVDKLGPDTDGDGIPDKYDKCDEDTDGDNIPNCQDPDSDGDTIPDSIEAGKVSSSGRPVDSDGDLIYDFMSKDADGNGIPDNLECVWGSDTLASGELVTKCTDTDNDTVPDFMDNDNDGDGLLDSMEIIGSAGKTPTAGKAAADCDHDGQLDDAGTVDSPFVCVGEPAFLNADSDGDTIADQYESLNDSNGDGRLDVYSLDSDGDGILDKDEHCGEGAVSCTIDDPPATTKTESGEVTNYRVADIDADGLKDGAEVMCTALGKHSRYYEDTDEDGYSDAAESVAAQFAIKNGLIVKGRRITSVDQMMCDASIGVKDVFNFYFELPYGGDSEDDKLLFTPKVSKLDLVFNVDTTGSMGGTIENVQTNISTIMDNVANMVTDCAFGLTAFDDFYISEKILFLLKYNYGSEGDLPFSVYGYVTTDKSVAKTYPQNKEFRASGGNDVPESGVESLYQIVTGEGVPGFVSAHKAPSGYWGGVNFRNNTLPVIIHTTDATSHDENNDPYDPKSGITGNHYTSQLIPKLQSTGTRVISLNVGSAGGDSKGQMTKWSKSSNAVVPVCAFNNSAGVSPCGGKCCLGDNQPNPTTINGEPNQCVLVYQGAQAKVNEYISLGVDALVKYGTYSVSTMIIGEPLPGKSYGTECFIKRVEALEYLAPSNEPEKSCNPKAVPAKVDKNKSYNDGFTNFATGTSSASKPGAQLTFTVVAQNDTCVEQTSEAQVFEATIRVINPDTGLIFDDQKVSIIVPAKVESTEVVY